LAFLPFFLPLYVITEKKKIRNNQITHTMNRK